MTYVEIPSFCCWGSFFLSTLRLEVSDAQSFWLPLYLEGVYHHFHRGSTDSCRDLRLLGGTSFSKDPGSWINPLYSNSSSEAHDNALVYLETSLATTATVQEIYPSMRKKPDWAAAEALSRLGGLSEG